MKKIVTYIFPFLSNESFRIEWVKKQLKRIPKGQSVLDVGAGEGRYKKYCEHLKYVSQDFNQYKGKGDGVGLQTGHWNTSKIDLVSDITSIPAKRNSFDNILCTEVLEHIPHPELAIKEISRLIKKGGKFILTAPFASQTHFSPYFFITGFSVNWYKKILPKYGFKIAKIEANGNYFDYVSQELVRLPMVAKKFTLLWIFSMLLYIPIIPLTMIFWMVSILSKKSEEYGCFGWHVLAKKI